jgi:hypothetical protein
MRFLDRMALFGRCAPVVAVLLIWFVTAGAAASSAWSDRSVVEPVVTVADIVTVSSVADATIMQGESYAGRNLGDTIDIWVGYDDYLTPDGETTRGLIRFNVPTIPAGNEVISATLRLYHQESWDFIDTFDTITAYGVGQSWQESIVTWNNAPPVGGAYGSVEVPQSPIHAWYELDITELAEGWIRGSIPNYGVYVRGEEAAGLDSSWRSFSSRESEANQSGFAPQLVIAYGPPGTPTHTPTATNTSTLTPTATRTSSPTATRTATSTVTWTPTVTHTSTATRTATVTRTPTATPTSAPWKTLWLPLYWR